MLLAIKLVEYKLDFDSDLQTQIDALNPLTYEENTRITIIDKDGEVLADTNEENLETIVIAKKSLMQWKMVLDMVFVILIH